VLHALPGAWAAVINTGTLRAGAGQLSTLASSAARPGPDPRPSPAADEGRADVPSLPVRDPSLGKVREMWHDDDASPVPTVGDPASAGGLD